MSERTYPNLFLIGAPKSGTTFLFSLLEKTSEVFAPHIKEPAYFHIRERKIKYKQRYTRQVPQSFTEAEYCRLYANRNERYVIDASTHYLSSPETASRIKKASPKAKIVAVLREPISRAFSHFLMGHRDGFVTESFPDALAQEKREMLEPGVLWSEHYRFIRRSLYLEGIKEFHAHFGDNMRLYLFDDIKAHPHFVIDDLCAFLSLNGSHLGASLETADRNPFAEDQFPMLTRAVQRYRESPLRDVVNLVVPVALRDKLRTGYDKKRLVHAEKPRLDSAARQILVDALGNDFAESLAYARQHKILREKASAQRIDA